MQIAGRDCWVCHQTVGTMRSGAGCEDCQTVVHQACAPNGVCPRCGKAFEPTEVVHGRLSPSEQTNRNRPRSVTFLAGWALLGAVLGLVRAILGLGTSNPDGMYLIVEGLLQFAIGGALGRGLFAGYGWARNFFLWATPILIALDYAFTDQSSTSPLLSWLLVVQGAVYGIWAYLLNRPAVIRFFQARTPGVQASARRSPE